MSAVKPWITSISIGVANVIRPARSVALPKTRKRGSVFVGTRSSGERRRDPPGPPVTGPRRAGVLFFFRAGGKGGRLGRFIRLLSCRPLHTSRRKADGNEADLGSRVASPAGSR